MYVDKLSGGFFALLGLILLFVLIPDQVELIESDGLTPQTFPVAISWLLVITGCTQLVITNKSKIEIRKEVIRVIALCSIFAGFIYIASWIQFIYLSPLLAFLLMKYMKENRLLWLGLGTLCTPFCIWFCVHVLLGRELI